MTLQLSLHLSRHASWPGYWLALRVACGTCFTASYGAEPYRSC